MGDLDIRMVVLSTEDISASIAFMSRLSA